MNTLQDADLKLKRLAEIDLLMADLTAARNDAVLQAETKYQAAAAPLAMETKEIIVELEAAYKANRAAIEAKGGRSVKLHFGRIGYRMGTGKLALMKGVKWPQVLLSLKERYKDNKQMLLKVIRTKESIIKDVLKDQVKPEVLTELGLRVAKKEEFFAEAFSERLKDAAA